MNSLVIWCGILGIIFSVVAVVVMFLTRKNIIDIIDKDIILFERNFDIKKNTIVSSFDIVDEIASKGKQVAMDPTFSQRAKKCYNELLCVVSNEKIAEEFYKIAIDFSFTVSMQRIIEYKIKCRKDIGLKTKKSDEPEDISAIKPIVQQPTQPSGVAKPIQQQNTQIKQPDETEKIQQPQQAKTSVQRAVVRPSGTSSQARPTSVSGAQKASQPKDNI